MRCRDGDVEAAPLRRILVGTVLHVSAPVYGHKLNKSIAEGDDSRYRAEVKYEANDLRIGFEGIGCSS